MDILDQKILEILKENARTKASDIGKQVHLSVSTVIERMRKMEASGIIEKYTVVTGNLESEENDMLVVIQISIEHQKYNEDISRAIEKHPDVLDCYYITGEYDYLVKCRCRSAEKVEEVHRWMSSLEGVKDTKTSYVLKKIKEF